MPYPPPPGPPDVGEFQAIGKLPAPQLPDVTGHGGDFLETDGFIPQWEPVSGALPDPAGHSGEYLTNNGVVANWAPVFGPTTGVYANIFDIRDYGAIPAIDPTDRTQAVVDCSDAFEAAIAAWVNLPTRMMFWAGFTTPVGGIYVPPGVWYISRPLFLPQGCVLYGDDPQLSVIASGPGVPGEALVQGFGGPIIFLAGKNFPGTIAPTYLSPLVGATGRSMKMWTFNRVDPIYPPSLTLEDCYAWSTYFQLYAAEACLRFWLKIDAAWSPGVGLHVIGFRSPSNLTPLNGALNISAITDNDGITVKLVATIYCQSNSGVQTITTDGVPVGSAFYVELDYNGAAFDFYINGVNKGHITATGRLYKRAWEVASIGDELPLSGEGGASIVGAIDSIELSDIARHTGVGGYTPPTSKHTADSHTLWLCNFDQGDPVPDSHGWIHPIMYAQTAQAKTTGLPASIPAWGAALAQPDHGGMVKHYVRLGGWVQGNLPNCAQVKIKNLQLYPRGNNSGIVLVGASRTRIESVWVYGASSYGLYCLSSTSFYSELKGCWTTALGIGSVWFGNAKDMEDHSSALGFWGFAGEYDNIAIQPEFNSFLPFCWGPASDQYSSIIVRNCGVDEEIFGGGLYQELAAAVCFDGTRVRFEGNIWDISGSLNPDLSLATRPAFIHLSQGAVSPVHRGDIFVGFTPQVGISTAFKAQPDIPVELEDCVVEFNIAITDIPNYVIKRTPNTVTNQKSLGASEIPGNNLVGTFSVLHGYTSGVATFIVPEPDANYEVQIQYKGYNGSAPAGSTEILGYVTSASSFTATVAADPGGNCELIYSYVIVRAKAAPLVDVYEPALPSSFTNPFAGEVDSLWAYGVTLIPAGGAAALRMNIAAGQQWVLGTGHSTTDDRYFLLGNGALESFYVQSVPQGSSAAVSEGFGILMRNTVVDGVLYSPWSPGPHNFAFAEQKNARGAGGNLVWEIFVDGGNVSTSFPGGAFISWTQQATIYVGHDPAAALNDLTTVTLRHLKIGRSYNQVITREQDAGPQVGMTINAFLGDEFLLGWSAGAAGLGGWATQVAEARYGAGGFYYFACNPNLNSSQVLNNFWIPWKQSLDINALVLNSGYYGLLQSHTSTDEWDPLLQILDGVYATAVSTPPTGNVDAWGFFITADEVAREANVPYGGAVGTCVIQGVSVTYSISSPVGVVPTMSTVAATVASLISAVNSDIVLGPLVTAVDAYSINPTNHALYITSNSPGFVGNSITTTTDGAGGSLWYPGDILGSHTLGGGINARITINGQLFEWIFNTDADTTVNDMIAQITADGPTIAVVTPTLVSHRLLLTSALIGAAGNAITVSNPGYLNSGLVLGGPNLVGGINGARTIVTAIVVATVPPFGDNPSYSAGKETERQAFNTLVRNYCAAHGGDGVVLLDIDATVKDGGDPTKIAAAFLAADSIHLNDAGEAAVQVVADPLIP